MSSSQGLATCTAKMCNILYKNVYQCVDNLMFFRRNPSIKKLHRNKVAILQKVSKCHSVNQEMVNLF